jgi:hypothetical protein
MIRVQITGYGLFLPGEKVGIITIIDILKILDVEKSGGK